MACCCCCLPAWQRCRPPLAFVCYVATVPHACILPSYFCRERPSIKLHLPPPAALQTRASSSPAAAAAAAGSAATWTSSLARGKQLLTPRRRRRVLTRHQTAPLLHLLSSSRRRRPPRSCEPGCENRRWRCIAAVLHITTHPKPTQRHFALCLLLHFSPCSRSCCYGTCPFPLLLPCSAAAPLLSLLPISHLSFPLAFCLSSTPFWCVHSVNKDLCNIARWILCSLHGVGGACERSCDAATPSLCQTQLPSVVRRVCRATQFRKAQIGRVRPLAACSPRSGFGLACCCRRAGCRSC